jgi:hypothetical protein
MIHIFCAFIGWIIIGGNKIKVKDIIEFSFALFHHIPITCPLFPTFIYSNNQIKEKMLNRECALKGDILQVTQTPKKNPFQHMFVKLWKTWGERWQPFHILLKQ